ncbi:thiolase family protein [Mesorhizobium sp. L-8-3]|uniref:thiolase family protein n=1 Tax=Mesorhizobium sp. L-8-3 TaxID=2744522 RepID=UPI001926499F|nr:thiolase family protein [Mesorhizobium sp. L-8-3]BCH20330.1 hypothetical protein MesoLjLb_01150 [Mesorhizobium sp. L-8-3]
MPAYIPYGAYWSTPFARWQTELAHLHSMKFAAHVAQAALRVRDIPVDAFDLAAYGMTVPQHRSFYGTPWVTAMLGAERLPGPLVNQACATGTRLLAMVCAEMAAGAANCALALSGDRTSNSPHVYYPAPAGPGGTGESENIVLDSFNSDPWARCAMVDTAENVARREGITMEEQHEVVLHRSRQYADALAGDRAFQKRYMPARLDVPDAGFRRTVSTLEGDGGVHPTDPEKLSKLKPVREGGTVTYAAQTHPADGNAGIVVTADAAKARDLAGDGSIAVEILAWGSGREEKGFMPAAPIEASRKALSMAGLGIGDLDAIKTHNPFAVNDIAFARAFGLDWRGMNNFGCSLIWGHPQGPTALRSVIELIEELASKGGGHGLFTGCAAGDSGMALVLRVG